MARPLRIEFPGAVYHVTSRGDRRENIFEDDVDRHALLDILGQGSARFNARVLSYCLMSNHYHFVLLTLDGNLSRLMRHINGVYTQTYNRRHGKVGHLFQGRFKAILVDRDQYLVAVCRYVELNPVRARMTPNPSDWTWSSYPANVGHAPAPPWLDINCLHGQMLGREIEGVADHVRAAKQYQAWVLAAPDGNIWQQSLRQQIYLGDDAFVQAMQQRMESSQANAKEVPKAQRRTPKTLAQWRKETPDNVAAMYLAYTQGGMTMTQIAAQSQLSISYVSRLIAAYEAK